MSTQIDQLATELGELLTEVPSATADIDNDRIRNGGKPRDLHGRVCREHTVETVGVGHFLAKGRKEHERSAQTSGPRSWQGGRRCVAHTRSSYEGIEPVAETTDV